MLRKWMPHAQASKGDVGKGKKASEKKSKVSTKATGTRNVPIDDQALKDMFGDDPETFKEIIQSFVQSSEAITGEIKDGWAKRSARDVRAAAHKLKSSARSVGANELADVCAALETAGKAEKWDAINELTPKLDPLFATVKQYVEAL